MDAAEEMSIVKEFQLFQETLEACANDTKDPTLSSLQRYLEDFSSNTVVQRVDPQDSSLQESVLATVFPNLFGPRKVQWFKIWMNSLPSMVVLTVNPEGTVNRKTTLEALLPDAFGLKNVFDIEQLHWKLRF
jgi:hypothetical protein